MGDDTLGAQYIALRVVSYQRVDAIILAEQRNGAPCDVAATNDEQSFHALIMR